MNGKVRDTLITCQEARDLMDRRDWLSGEEGQLLKTHVKTCSACATEEKVEQVLRTVMVPEDPPTISPDFEHTLMVEIGLLERKPKTLVNWLRWFLPVILLSVPIVIHINSILAWIYCNSALIYAQGASILAGQKAIISESLIADMPVLLGMDASLAFNILLAGIVLLAGLVAVSWTEKYHRISDF